MTVNCNLVLTNFNRSQCVDVCYKYGGADFFRSKLKSGSWLTRCSRGFHSVRVIKSHIIVPLFHWSPQLGDWLYENYKNRTCDIIVFYLIIHGYCPDSRKHFKSTVFDKRRSRQIVTVDCTLFFDTRIVAPGISHCLSKTIWHNEHRSWTIVWYSCISPVAMSSVSTESLKRSTEHLVIRTSDIHIRCSCLKLLSWIFQMNFSFDNI